MRRNQSDLFNVLLSSVVAVSAFEGFLLSWVPVIMTWPGPRRDPLPYGLFVRVIRVFIGTEGGKFV